MITQHGPRCDVCGLYILFDKSINPFSVKGIERELHSHDKCKLKVEGSTEWKQLPEGPLRKAFEDVEVKVTDDATIRAKANDMAREIAGMPLVEVQFIEAALTAAHDAGWDEAIEAAENVPYDPCKRADILKAKETAIRRLRKGKP